MVGIGREPARIGPRRGDVHIVTFEDIGGHVLRGPHPAVIASSDRLNRPTGTVLFCSMTSRQVVVQPGYLPPYLVRATRQETGLDRDGWVKCDQVFSRPAAGLGPRIGRLNPEVLQRVADSLRFVLDV